MKTYRISGIVDVGMYNTILDPDVTLPDDDISGISEDAQVDLWMRFNPGKYAQAVLFRAIIELRNLLEKLPDNEGGTYVEGSAEIDSPPFYNYRNDEFWFSLETATIKDKKEYQALLDAFFDADFHGEFGGAYRIYEYIRTNCTIHDFLNNTEDGERRDST